MNTIEYNVECLAGARICLGFKGEAERTQVVIDASSWLEEFGSGGLLRLRHAPQNEQIYSPTGQTVEDGVLTWTIGASDTSTGGIGQAEVWYTITDENEVEHKVASAVFQTKVLWSLATVSSTVPSGIEDWLEEADAALETINSKASQTDLEAEVERATVAEAYLQEQIDQSGGGGGAVSSVNGKTGAVVLGASDVGALPDDTTIPSKTSQLQNDSGFLTSAPVISVNSKTGAVTLSASDVGALPDDTAIPTKTSDLQNDSGFITSVPVSSVDGKTGAVTILPSGGSQGQVLKKSSSADYAVEWANESGGGGGTSDYTDLTNKPSINSVTLSGNKTASDLGLAAASDIPTVPTAYTSAPSDLGTASAGSSTKWARGDHVHKMPTASDVGAYVKPSGGIPSSDLASAVQTSLGLADTALQSSAIANMQTTGNLVTSVSSSSTDSQYPSAKLLYDTVGNIETLLAAI